MRVHVTPKRRATGKVPLESSEAWILIMHVMSPLPSQGEAHKLILCFTWPFTSLYFTETTEVRRITKCLANVMSSYAEREIITVRLPQQLADPKNLVKLRSVEFRALCNFAHCDWQGLTVSKINGHFQLRSFNMNSLVASSRGPQS
jgi:hypothetical protein